jgi:hypothetical protein
MSEPAITRKLRFVPALSSSTMKSSEKSSDIFAS